MIRSAMGAVLAAVTVMCLTSSLHAASGDTTWVRTFENDFYNWADPHEQTFTFPDTTAAYGKIVLFYRLGCPTAPGDCDPWDRLGHLTVLHDTGDPGLTGRREVIPYEIARIVTPYDITGGNYPGSCTWEIDVSDYEPILHNEVTLSNYIESWIGGVKGWLVTLDFAFIEGGATYEPYQIINLWSNYHAVYGDPSRPIEEYLQPVDVPIDEDIAAAKVRVITTGHGQGNTYNCAEFCAMWHTILAGETEFTHQLWRYDCNVNPCSPQGGTWPYARAGWCPGADVIPWDLDITNDIVPGESITLDYNIYDYENLCRPNNPDCVSPGTCTDCNYNYNGHTEPHYALAGQLILYKINPLADVDSFGDMPGDTPGDLPGDTGLWAQNTPNPFGGMTEIRYSIFEAGQAKFVIYDAAGRFIRMITQEHKTAGGYSLQWDGKDSAGRDAAPGVYFYTLDLGRETLTRKMMLLK
ncbi:MAG: T9SS type A sorting domain-containing protein [Candidatus Eisenbacteria bacterium]|uniref:T9SS type A sorting domain-containing protein n=1 Tax=Eiseniibacteriota bacterium TaxID=2212470 RepID=A0A948RZH6_UNCEI|nr:T9SS type A sorting domain-containing protein [Candidatus Eisenbacteria bacterium]